MQRYQVPASIKSVYRIFLRACAAAVLHHSAKHALRRLWRANFDEAVSVHRQCVRQDLAAHDRAKRIEWLRVWESRADNTLEMLLSSGASRGLPHKLTRNLALIQWSFADHCREKWDKPGPVWNPSPALYKDADTLARNLRIAEKRRRGALRGRDGDFDEHACGALEEVVRMAEGSAGLMLGRPSYRRVRGFLARKPKEFNKG